MTPDDIYEHLRSIALHEDFAHRSSELTSRWESGGTSVEAIEPILRFMEDHPSLDLGMPGPLVHFAEQFFGRGYEERLVKSLERKPTGHTAWMLHRVINGTTDLDARRRLTEILTQAGAHPLADNAAKQQIDHLLRGLTR
jgi:hypothetical protein